jgi:hypothetical protein
LLVQILSSGWLTHAPHKHEETVGRQDLTLKPNVGFAANEMFARRIVCFCDIPLSELAIHMRKYSSFGIAFSRSFLVSKGASPVFYVATNSIVAVGENQLTREAHFDERLGVFHKIWQRVMEQGEEVNRKYGVEYTVNPDGTTVSKEPSGDAYGAWLKERREIDELAHLMFFLSAQVFGFTKAFDSRKDDDDDENFYMEREWRVAGNVNFSLSDVTRIILPEAYAARFRADVPEYIGQIHFASN